MLLKRSAMSQKPSEKTDDSLLSSATTHFMTGALNLATKLLLDEKPQNKPLEDENHHSQNYQKPR